MGASISDRMTISGESEITRIPLGGLAARRDGGILWSVQKPSGDIVIGGLSTGTVAALAYVSESLDLEARTMRATAPISVNSWSRDRCPVCGAMRECDAVGTSRCGDCRARAGAILLLGKG